MNDGVGLFYVRSHTAGDHLTVTDLVAAIDASSSSSQFTAEWNWKQKLLKQLHRHGFLSQEQITRLKFCIFFFFHLRLKLKLNRLATAAVLHCSNIEVGFANTETSEVQKHRYTSPWDQPEKTSPKIGIPLVSRSQPVLGTILEMLLLQIYHTMLYWMHKDPIVS